MTKTEQDLRAIHLRACTAVALVDWALTPAVDAFWPLYLQAALRFAGTAENAAIGYLSAIEVARLHSGHDANLRSAKFGPSQFDGDVAVFLAARCGDNAVGDATRVATLISKVTVPPSSVPNTATGGAPLITVIEPDLESAGGRSK